MSILKDVTLNDQTTPQIKICIHNYSEFFSTHKYQNMWNNNDRNAFINFPSLFDCQKILPFIADNADKHPHCL